MTGGVQRDENCRIEHLDIILTLGLQNPKPEAFCPGLVSVFRFKEPMLCYTRVASSFVYADVADCRIADASLSYCLFALHLTARIDLDAVPVQITAAWIS